MSTSQKNYFAAFNTAEGHLKSAEIFVQSMSPSADSSFIRGLLFPAVNELRYAAHHAVRACEAETLEKQVEAWLAAEGHCRRASYDTFDVQLQYLIGECGNFQKDYKKVLIGSVIEGYQQDCRKLNEIKMIDYKRDGNHAQHWQKMEENVKVLKEIIEKWNIGRNELNKMLTKEQNNRWYNTVIIVSSIISAVIGTIALYYSMPFGTSRQ